MQSYEKKKIPYATFNDQARQELMVSYVKLSITGQLVSYNSLFFLPTYNSLLISEYPLAPINGYCLHILHFIHVHLSTYLSP